MFVLLFQKSQNVNPKDSFAWKDKTLDTELKALRDARYYIHPRSLKRFTIIQSANLSNGLKCGYFIDPQIKEGGDA